MFWLKRPTDASSRGRFCSISGAVECGEWPPLVYSRGFGWFLAKRRPALQRLKTAIDCVILRPVVLCKVLRHTKSRHGVPWPCPSTLQKFVLAGLSPFFFFPLHIIFLCPPKINVTLCAASHLILSHNPTLLPSVTPLAFLLLPHRLCCLSFSLFLPLSLMRHGVSH